MQQPTDNSSRKKFLWWGAAALAAVGSWKLFGGRIKKKEPETIKMLTQDGRLVEMDKSLLAATTKATDKDLQDWIKK